MSQNEQKQQGPTPTPTPGPWRDAGGGICKVTGNSPETGEINVVIPFSSRPANEADVRLIAAAPDLLEALENLIAWHDADHNNSRDAIDQGRDAIAKARAMRGPQ